MTTGYNAAWRRWCISLLVTFAGTLSIQGCGESDDHTNEAIIYTLGEGSRVTFLPPRKPPDLPAPLLGTMELLEPDVGVPDVVVELEVRTIMFQAGQTQIIGQGILSIEEQSSGALLSMSALVRIGSVDVHLTGVGSGDVVSGILVVIQNLRLEGENTSGGRYVLTIQAAPEM